MTRSRQSSEQMGRRGVGVKEGEQTATQDGGGGEGQGMQNNGGKFVWRTTGAVMRHLFAGAGLSTRVLRSNEPPVERLEGKEDCSRSSINRTHVRPLIALRLLQQSLRRSLCSCVTLCWSPAPRWPRVVRPPLVRQESARERADSCRSFLPLPPFLLPRDPLALLAHTVPALHFD